MTKKRKRKYKKKPFIIMLLILVIILLAYYFFFSNKPMSITVVSEIDGYNYYLNSNTTRLYKKYYKELESELSDNKVDEENYAKLISKLFAIDFYTLNNKITNRDVGGVQFIHSNLQDKFIDDATSSVYKYIKSNISGNRKQKLSEVNKVSITSIESIEYENDDYNDESGYKVVVAIEYVKDYDYPDEITLTIIHEDNKLVIVEVA